MPRKIVFSLLLAMCIAISVPGIPAAYSSDENILPQNEFISQINPYVVTADVKAFLSEEEYECFTRLVDAVFAREQCIKMTDDFDSNLACIAALMSNPFYFLVEDFELIEKNTAVKLTYAYTKAEQTQMSDFIMDEYLGILNEIITPEMNELDKALAVYGYFAKRIKYDFNWLQDYNASVDKFLYPDIEIYQALSTNLGVCHSYTYLCEFAYQQIGIESLRFIGSFEDSDESHMWLVVKINGEYYHCDPTWDSHYDGAGLDHFGLTDSERRDSGLMNFETSYDMAYGEIECTSTALEIFRGVENFEFGEEPHILMLDYGWDVQAFDTQQMIFLNQP